VATLVDPCTVGAGVVSITPSAQTNPDDYLYTADSPQAAFSLNSLTIEPAWCVPVYTCSVLSGGPDICSAVGPSTSGVFNSATGGYTFESIDMVNYPPGTY